MLETQFFDITQWNRRIDMKPQKGSRPNELFEDPSNNDLFFFKQSKENYPTEIWSEIIASKLGQSLGFGILDYNLALFENCFGCISKTMVLTELGEVLYHGVDILNDFIEGYQMTKKPICSFQNWEEICEKPEFKSFLNNFIEIIVFDALIGNTDRHTENWAFIRRFVVPNATYDNSRQHWRKRLSEFIRPKEQNENNNKFSYSFAPIYDSGSCLGREFTDAQIATHLANEEHFVRFMAKGFSEIRWKDDKVDFFELIRKVGENHKEMVQLKLKPFFLTNIYDKVEELVRNIDRINGSILPETILLENRKQYIIKLLNKRIEKLKSVVPQ